MPNKGRSECGGAGSGAVCVRVRGEASLAVDVAFVSLAPFAGRP